jgi:hypothetical protein
MIVKGLRAYEVHAVIETVSGRNFGGNLIAKRAPEDYRGCVRFTLALRDSRGPGHRLGFTIAANGKQRRLAAACFHAYGEVIRALLIAGAAYVQSAPITLQRVRSKGARPLRWTGETWKENADAMAYVNIGSQFEPLMFCEACECEQGPMPMHGETVYAASIDWPPMRVDLKRKVAR